MIFYHQLVILEVLYRFITILVMVVAWVVAIVTVHLHDIVEVHHLVVDDFQVDDEVDDDEEDDGNYFLLFS